MRSPSLSKSRECQTSQSRRASALLASDMCSPVLIEVPIPGTIGSEPQAIRISLQIPRNVRSTARTSDSSTKPFEIERGLHAPTILRKKIEDYLHLLESVHLSASFSHSLHIKNAPVMAPVPVSRGRTRGVGGAPSVSTTPA